MTRTITLNEEQVKLLKPIITATISAFTDEIVAAEEMVEECKGVEWSDAHEEWTKDLAMHQRNRAALRGLWDQLK